MPPLSQVITIDWKDIVYCTVLLYLWRFGSTLFGIQRSTDVIFPCVPCNVKYCVSAPEADGFDLAGRDQALVCGIEAHVCVNQTVLDLLDQGLEVHVALDAVDSRFEQNKAIGLEKMERAGAVITSVETALFELVGRAGTDEFKRVQGIVLDYAPNPI